MALAVSGFTVPCRNTVRARIERRYDSEREQLVQTLKQTQSAAITTDTWTSTATESYLTVTAHHITDDWELQGNVLATRAMPERHTGRNLAARLKETVEEFGLDGKIETCVHDNARNMECAGSMCKDWSDLGCSAHTLQLCIRPALEIPSVDKTVSRARKLVGHSTTLTTELQKRQENNQKTPRTLVQDVATRWNSTYDMVERLAELRREVTDVVLDDVFTKKHDRSLLLKDTEWDILQDVSTALLPFKQTTSFMCSEKSVSVSEMYPVVSGLIRVISPSDGESSVARKVKRILQDELTRRFDPTGDKSAQSVPMIASLLDPRYKKLSFIDSHLRKKTQEALEAQMDEAPLSIGSSTTVETPSKRPRLDFLVFSAENTRSVDELQQYLAEKSEDVDPLTWWQRKADQYPHVAYVARQLLAVPTTSVPSERVFSAAGLIVSKLRNKLSSDIVDKIVFLNKNQSKK